MIAEVISFVWNIAVRCDDACAVGVVVIMRPHDGEVGWGCAPIVHWDDV